MRRGVALLLGVLLPGLLGLVGCGFGGGALGGGTTLHLSADLASSAGLFVGNDVGILGVTVGRITAITPEGDHVRVDMDVQTDHRIPADAGAVVVARSVATDRYLELTPVYRSGPTIQDGATIPVSRTRTPVEFDEVLGAIQRFATGISGSKRTTEAVKRFIDVGQRTLAGNGRLLNTTIGQLSGATTDVAAQRRQVVALISALDDLVSSVVRNRSTIDRFIGQVSDATAQLAAERGNLRSALDSLDRAVTLVARFAVDNRATIKATLRDAGGLMSSVLEKRRQLEEILQVMPTGLENLQRARAGDRLNVRFSPIYLLPLSDELTRLCEGISTALCNQVTQISDVIGQVLGAVDGVLGGLLGGPGGGPGGGTQGGTSGTGGGTKGGGSGGGSGTTLGGLTGGLLGGGSGGGLFGRTQ